MRYLIVIACFACANALTDEQNQLVKEHLATCIKTVGVTPEDVEKLQNGGIKGNKDEKIQCFAKCFLEQAGLMNADGEFLDNVAIEKLAKGNAEHSEKIKSVVEECKNVTGDNPCHKAFKLYECYVKHHALFM